MALSPPQTQAYHQLYAKPVALKLSLLFLFPHLREMHMCVSTTSDKKLQLLNKSIPTESRQQMSTYFYLK